MLLCGIGGAITSLITAGATKSSPRNVGSGLGVFADNRKRPIHRWYPFVEGYSSELVERALQYDKGRTVTIFDPFGGSGTTALAASLRGHDSFYCEVNPYLAWVANAKINCAREAASDPQLGRLLDLADLVERGRITEARGGNPLITADYKRKYFEPGTARQVVGITEWIGDNLRHLCPTSRSSHAQRASFPSAT